MADGATRIETHRQLIACKIRLTISSFATARRGHSHPRAIKWPEYRLLDQKSWRPGIELYPTITKIEAELSIIGSVPIGIQAGLLVVSRSNYPVLYPLN